MLLQFTAVCFHCLYQRYRNMSHLSLRYAIRLPKMKTNVTPISQPLQVYFLVSLFFQFILLLVLWGILSSKTMVLLFPSAHLCLGQYDG